MIIEVDGGQHVERSTADVERTRILQDASFEVLRFWNDEVLTNIDGVSQRVLETARRA